MTHDPLCPLDSECPGRDRPHFLVESDTWCGGCQIECQCDLIAKVRADEQAKYVLPDLPRGEEHVDWCRDLACYGCVEVTE